MKKINIAVGLILVITLLFSGCVNQTFRGSHTTKHSIMDSPKSFAESYEIDIKNDFTSFNVKIDFKLKEGKLSWQLIDPKGEVIWSEAISDKDRLKETKSFKPIPGKWIINFTGEKAAGDFLIEGKAK